MLIGPSNVGVLSNYYLRCHSEACSLYIFKNNPRSKCVGVVWSDANLDFVQIFEPIREFD